MNPRVFEGGCLCGAVRYRATGTPYNLTNCHCADCRKASGAPFVAWASFRRDNFTFTQGQPAQIHWAGRVRSFCPHCGTSLTFLMSADSEEVDVTIASLDEPAALAPRDRLWVDDRLPWIQLADGLPCCARHRTQPQGASR